MNIQERTSEIMKIFVKLRELNLGITGYTEFVTFRQICNEFIRTGIPSEGQIKVLGTKRVIVYNFYNTVDCALKYDPRV
jgi:hypothetical protein